MDTTKRDYLFRVEAPWVFIGAGEVESRTWVPSHFYARPGLTSCVRQLRGWKMSTTQSLMDEVSAALQFFEGFGENWSALSECLSCLDEWLPADAYVLVVERAEEVLSQEHPDELAAFLKTLHRVGQWWAEPITSNGRFNRGAIPFHTLLHVTQTGTVGIDRITRTARDAQVPVRA